MTISKRNGKYYCRFQINGERHHYLCNGAVSLKEAEQMENAFKYKLMQQQNGLIPKEDKARVKLKKLKDNFLTYSQINRAVYSQDVGRIRIIFEFFDENRFADTVVRKDVDEFKFEKEQEIENFKAQKEQEIKDFEILTTEGYESKRREDIKTCDHYIEFAQQLIEEVSAEAERTLSENKQTEESVEDGGILQ